MGPHQRGWYNIPEKKKAVLFCKKEPKNLDLLEDRGGYTIRPEH
jgi:hypothetical protein